MMKDADARVRSILGSALFLIVAPGTVAGLAPWWISGWQARPPFWRVPVLPALGVLLVVVGVAVLLDSFFRFAVFGQGTPAPVLPTRKLVVVGWYRYVRNPMYLAVFSLIIGQGLILSDFRLLEYGIVVWFCFHVFVLAYEEPTLRRTYGGEYDQFCANVPRWLPRLDAWSHPS